MYAAIFWKRLSAICVASAIAVSPLAAQTADSAKPQEPEVEASEDTDLYAPLEVKTFIRISPDIAERRDEIVAFVSSQPGWEIADDDRTEFEVVPNPEYYQDLLFSRLKRYSYDRTTDRLTSPAMDIADIMKWNDPRPHATWADRRGKGKFPGPGRADEDQWALRIPVPVDLGPESGPDLFDRLGAAMQPIARHHALIGFINNSPSDLELCVSNEPAPEGLCLTSTPGAVPTLMYFRPIYIRATSERSLPEGMRSMTFVAIAPNRAIIPLGTVATSSSATADPVTGEQRLLVWGDNYSAPARLEEFGHYHIMAIATAEPIDPAVWAIRPGDTVLPPSCGDPVVEKLCGAMRGVFDFGGDGVANAALGEIDVFSDLVYGVAPVGGNLAGLKDGKWQAQLFLPREGAPLAVSGARGPGAVQRQNFEKSHKCGGSYLGDGFILTAAHCVAKRELGELQVRLGTLDIAVGGSNFPIVAMAIHGDYGKTRGNADIAVLKIRPDSRLAALERKGLLGKIDLAPPMERLANGTTVMMTGWGFTGATDGGSEPVDSRGNAQRNARYLTRVNMATRPSGDCTRFAKMSSFGDADIICAKAIKDGEDACFGDSGGPLTRLVGERRVLVGIVAAGIGCAQAGVPGVYTRVAAFRQWIDQAKLAAAVPGKHVLDKAGRAVR